MNMLILKKIFKFEIERKTFIFFAVSIYMFYKYVKDLIIKGNRLNTITVSYNKRVANSLISGFPNKYSGLDVRVGFGKGVWARIPWIGFLGVGQKVTQGIYPVLLYYREIDLLILAYGVSASKAPSISWGMSTPQTIGAYFKRSKIKAHGAYNKSFVYKVYKASTIDPSINDDIDELIRIYKKILFSSTPTIPSVSASASVAKVIPMKMVDSIINVINSSGLIYQREFISRFVISLMTKPFVILSGLAGSGKTQLSIAFAKAMSNDVAKQVRIVPVGADWTNREPLLGYPSALEEGKYIYPDSKVLQLVIDASKDPENPYFLILDEMNLSYVERYFADFLSAIESRAAIPLWDKNLLTSKKIKSKSSEVPESIALPCNLFIIGTINVDETTYMFSPKVLDRASVLEFRINEENMGDFFNKAPTVNLDKIEGTLVSCAKDFVEISKEKTAIDYSSSKDTLISFFKELKTVNAEFGYRSASEIGRFIELAIKYGGFSEDNATDAAIVQKLLPKLHGSQKKLVPVLKKLWELCVDDVELNRDAIVPDKTVYQLSADKILRMYKSAVDNGFTSFAEA